MRADGFTTLFTPLASIERRDLSPLNHLHSWKAFLGPKLQRVGEFLALQGVTLAANLFYGFLCVRLLPIPEYAKYAVVFGFLGTVTILMDVGFSGTLLPLIGERIDDLQLIADYVASLRRLALRLFLVVAPAAIVVYPLLVHRQHWGSLTVAAMVAILLVTAWSARVSGAYGAVLIVRRDRSYWYRVQMTSALGTLALLGLAWATHTLNAFSAILINVAGIVYTATVYFLRARRLLGVAGHPSRERRREIIHLSLPTLPNVIFYALQGQVSILLIVLFGHTTTVAGVGALGRLAQLFIVFSQMGPLLVEPYFASLPKERVKRSYLGIFAVEAVICGVMTSLARFFPGLFLWILGPKYSGLRYEVFLMIAASSLGYFTSTFWFIHNARRFVYWWNTFSIIAMTLTVEIYFIMKVDLSTVRGVLDMRLWIGYGSLLVCVATGIYGFVRGPRKLAERQMIAVETDYV